MKIAISGKGGVGKTMLTSLLSVAFAESGYSVLAIDADPNVNLAAAFGLPNSDKIVPISRMDDLIEERTGARPGQMAPYFKVNPKVDDLPEKCSLEYDGIKIMVMGPIKAAGTGCYCPEGALLGALVAHLLLEVNQVVILDMEAGIEHLTRGTAKGVDKLIIVVEPGMGSVATGRRVRDLALEIGLQNIGVVGNKVRSTKDQDFLTSEMPDFEFLGFIPYDEAIVEADMAGLPLVDSSPRVMTEVRSIAAGIMEQQLGETARENNSEKNKGGSRCR